MWDVVDVVMYIVTECIVLAFFHTQGKLCTSMLEAGFVIILIIGLITIVIGHHHYIIASY
jgi:hypothetical protein